MPGDPGRFPRPAKPGQRGAVPVPGVGSSPAADAIWAAGRGARISASDAPAGKFGAGSTGRGSACFTGLIAQRWPVRGHKKTPASGYQRGRCGRCGGVYSSAYKKSIVMRPGKIDRLTAPV
jgi:hypothetical protein